MQAAAPAEELVWEGSPSQWLGFGTYLFSGLAAVILMAAAVYLQSGSAPASLRGVAGPTSFALLTLALLPFFFALRTYLTTRTTRYRLTSERVLTSRGIFSRKTDNLELYRVDDMFVAQPFFLRLVGRGNIVITTSDRSNPLLTLAAIPDSQVLRDTMRHYVEICRDRKRTRVVDMD